MPHSIEDNLMMNYLCEMVVFLVYTFGGWNLKILMIAFRQLEKANILGTAGA